MNLNWVRIKLREKENQLSSRYDRGTLNSVIIFRKRHNILERYDFGTKKHIEARFNLSLAEGPNMLCFCFMFPGACQLFFLLARFGRKTDRHIKNIRMFF